MSGYYNARDERARKERDTPARIYEIAKAKGSFSVSLRYRDDWLRARCGKLKSAGYLVGGRRHGREVIYYPAANPPAEPPPGESPVPCKRVTVGGVTAIVCGPKQKAAKPCRCGSGQPADLLCDWKVPTKRSGTCDAKLCASCTSSPAPGKDLCPTHAAEWARRQALRASR